MVMTSIGFGVMSSAQAATKHKVKTTTLPTVVRVANSYDAPMLAAAKAWLRQPDT